MKSSGIELIHGDGEVEYAVIWLHGLGASANDFPPVVPELGLDRDRGAIRFIFPQAPNRPITINGGMSMPGWYDIKGVDIQDKEDAIGMAESRQMLDGLIEQQIKLGVSSENIIVAGFSQGGAVAYHTGLRSKHKLAGIMALSTYLAFAESLNVERAEANIQTPILVNHGTHDQVVPIELAKLSVDALLKLDYRVEYQVYPMEHQVIIEQIKDIGRWINKRFMKNE